MQKETPEPKFRLVDTSHSSFSAPSFCFLCSSIHAATITGTQQCPGFWIAAEELIWCLDRRGRENLQPTWRPRHHSHEEAFSASLRSHTFAQLLFDQWQLRTWNTSPISPPCSWRLDCSSPCVCLCSKRVSSKVRIQIYLRVFICCLVHIWAA